jgi:FG-GAP-like repeat
MHQRQAARIGSLCALLLASASYARAASITLAWDANPEPHVAGYLVYFGNQSGQYYGTVDAGNQTSITLPWLLDGAPYYFVVRAYTATGLLSPPSVEVSRRVGIPFSVAGDFDGDSRADMTVYRPSSGQWFLRSIDDNGWWSVYQWGENGDIPVPGDYDGDSKMDPAVYRPSTGVWWLLESSTNYATWIINQWGTGGDVPVAGDYDGDGKTDMAVYRPSTGVWYLLESSTNHSTWIELQWGISGDTPTPGDYDGDGKTDVAVYRPSTGVWYLLESSTNHSTWIVLEWGIGGDIPVLRSP